MLVKNSSMDGYIYMVTVYESKEKRNERRFLSISAIDPAASTEGTR